MAESLILFPLDMLENVAVTVGVDGSKSVIKLKEINNKTEASSDFNRHQLQPLNLLSP